MFIELVIAKYEISLFNGHFGSVLLQRFCVIFIAVEIKR